jgi:hypothetical protein
VTDGSNYFVEFAADCLRPPGSPMLKRRTAVLLCVLSSAAAYEPLMTRRNLATAVGVAGVCVSAPSAVPFFSSYLYQVSGGCARGERLTSLYRF